MNSRVSPIGAHIFEKTCCGPIYPRWGKSGHFKLHLHIPLGAHKIAQNFLPGCQELSWGSIKLLNCQIRSILHTEKKRTTPGPENVAFYSHEKSANKEIKGLSWWPDLPHVLIILSYSKTSKLVSKIHAICKVLDPIPISNTKKLPKMTIVEVVIKFITIYQLSYQYRLGMKLC